MLFVAPTGVGKTHVAFDLLKREHFNHFDFIVILCTTLQYNEMYRSRKWVWTDPYIIPIEPGNHLYDLIKKLGNILAEPKALFLIDDITADKTFDKQRQPLLDLAVSGRHKGHSLWLLAQSYTTVTLNIRRQAKMLHIWYLKHRKDWVTIHEENHVIESPELDPDKNQLRQGKHTCLVMRTEHPRDYEIMRD